MKKKQWISVLLLVLLGAALLCAGSVVLNGLERPLSLQKQEEETAFSFDFSAYDASPGGMANAAAAKEQEEQQTEEEASQQEVQEQPVEDTPEVIAWRNGRAAGVLLVSLGVVAVLAAGLLLLVFYFVNLRETRRAAGERLREREEKRIPKLSDNARVLKMYLMAPNRWWLRVIIVAIVALILAWSASSIQYNGLASKGSEVASGVVWGISHPDTNLLFNSTSDGVLYQLLETMAIALLGTLFGGILAIPFSFLASDTVVPKWLAFLTRAFILMIRTIPSLVWALVWIRVVGPGPFCGVLTQSICSIGMISKMYITAIDDLDRSILESLDACGCNAFQKIRYGVMPQLSANCISTMIYRFDINVKDATTLGIVGAGGIGAALVQCISSRRWSMVGAYLTGMIVLMLIIEFFSTRIRKKLARG